jgi:hypothetical protein
LSRQEILTVHKEQAMSEPTKVNLASLRGERRKKGRVATADPALIANIQALDHQEALTYDEAFLTSSTYKAEEKKALAVIMREKQCDENEARAVFENRWISRYRQRAQSAWSLAGMPDKEMDFVILNDGRILIGRK